MNMNGCTPEQWFSVITEIERDVEAQARREVDACAAEGGILDYDATLAYLQSERDGK